MGSANDYICRAEPELNPAIPGGAYVHRCFPLRETCAPERFLSRLTRVISSCKNIHIYSCAPRVREEISKCVLLIWILCADWRCQRLRVAKTVQRARWNARHISRRPMNTLRAGLRHSP